MYKVYGKQPSRQSPRPRKADPPRVTEHGHVFLHDVAAGTDAVFVAPSRQLQAQTVEKELLREVYDLKRREEQLRQAVLKKDERLRVLEEDKAKTDLRIGQLEQQNEQLHNELTQQQNEFFRLNIENSSLTTVRTELEEQLVQYKTSRLEAGDERRSPRGPHLEDHKRNVNELLEQLAEKERENRALRDAVHGKQVQETRSPHKAGRDLADLSPERGSEPPSPEPQSEEYAPLSRRRTSQMLANWLGRPREPSPGQASDEERRRRRPDERSDDERDPASQARDERLSKASESSRASAPSDRDVQHALDGLTQPKKRSGDRMSRIRASLAERDMGVPGRRPSAELRQQDLQQKRQELAAKVREEKRASGDEPVPRERRRRDRQL